MAQVDIHNLASGHIRASQRVGQAYFNAAYELDPDFADRHRGTILDPFYDDSKLPDFLTLWHTNRKEY